VIKPQQTTLFGFDGSPDELIAEIIKNKPSEELREGYIWHIGNVRDVGDNDGFIFAAGRTTKKSKALYDEESKDFLEVDDEESPFTYAYYDRGYGILGIEPKSKLSPTAKGISRNLEKLLNKNDVVRNSGIKIEISEIWDPEDFLKHIRESYSVVGFTVNFGNPNPFDVEADFHRPMENYLQATGGDKGKAAVQGPDLDRDKIEEVTRSVASTGNDASARIRLYEGQRPVTKHLEGDPVVVPIKEEERTEAIGLFGRIRNAYSRIRMQRKE
jgi:hypothetical protein